MQHSEIKKIINFNEYLRIIYTECVIFTIAFGNFEIYLIYYWQDIFFFLTLFVGDKQSISTYQLKNITLYDLFGFFLIVSYNKTPCFCFARK